MSADPRDAISDGLDRIRDGNMLHSEKITAILAALSAAGLVVEQGWQPIETAPRDRPVEVYAPSPDPARWTPEVHNLPPCGLPNTMAP